MNLSADRPLLGRWQSVKKLLKWLIVLLVLGLAFYLYVYLS